MKHNIFPLIALIGLTILLIGASMADGGSSLRDAALMGIIGLAILAVGVAFSGETAEAARREEQAAIRRSRTVQAHKEARRKAS